MIFESWTCWHGCVDLLVEVMQNPFSDLMERRRLALILCLGSVLGKAVQNARAHPPTILAQEAYSTSSAWLLSVLPVVLTRAMCGLFAT